MCQQIFTQENIRDFRAVLGAGRGKGKKPKCLSSTIIRRASGEPVRNNMINKYIRWEVVGIWLFGGLGVFLLSIRNRKGTDLDSVVQHYCSGCLQAEAQRFECLPPGNTWHSHLGRIYHLAVHQQVRTFLCPAATGRWGCGAAHCSNLQGSLTSISAHLYPDAHPSFQPQPAAFSAAFCSFLCCLGRRVVWNCCCIQYFKHNPEEQHRKANTNLRPQQGQWQETGGRVSSNAQAVKPPPRRISPGHSYHSQARKHLATCQTVPSKFRY